MGFTKAKADDNGVAAKLELRYFTTAQVAAYTGLSESYFEKARLRGDGPPFIKIGTRVLYDVRLLDEWLASRRMRSTSDLIACNDNFLARLKAVANGHS